MQKRGLFPFGGLKSFEVGCTFSGTAVGEVTGGVLRKGRKKF